MYLKALDIYGFKSFADKISLEFNSGITGVVGPNGSGKSNVSDAVRWVLGEQSAKALRGSRMEDIIFAGTEHRKPLGFAEVSLTIDNSDGTLPVSFCEVTVARRVFRSGESEYYINKTPCRLKDIHELFMDTGIGREGYSIIGQGRVDEILSSKSEDRRQIFEEASGIMKYKVRKLDSEKKLELTKQNLVRIDDIISELEAQIEPLKHQARVARKYMELREGLKELEVNVYVENISRLKEKVKDYEEQYYSLKQSIDKESLRMEEIIRSNGQKTQLLKLLEERLEASRKEFYSLETHLERCGSQIKLNEEKMESLEENVSRLDSEIIEINHKLEQLSGEEDDKNNKLLSLDTGHRGYSDKLSAHELRLRKIIDTLSKSERHIEALKAGVMDKLDVLSDKKMQINNLNIHIEGIRKRQVSLENEIFGLSLEKDRDKVKKQELEQNIKKASEAIERSREKLDSLSREKGELDSSLSEQRKRESAFKSEMQLKASRYKMLQDMEKGLEGYNRSVKEILHACGKLPEFGKGIHGALAQIITVDLRYETAVEMSLGGALQNIVTSTEGDAKRAIEFLKRDRLGRASFLPISSVKGRRFDSNAINEIRKQEGFCGVASDLISYGPLYEGIILSLLGRVVVVENLEAGIKIARKFAYSFRIVTLEGDILNVGGSMSGGSMDRRSTGILSRSREISELKETVISLQKKLHEAGKNIGEITGMLEEVSGEISLEQKEMRENELLKIRDESHFAQVVQSISRLEAKAEMLAEEKLQDKRQEKAAVIELFKYQKELRDIENIIEETRKAIESHQEKHKEERSACDSLSAEITELKVLISSVKQSIQGTKEAIERIVHEKELTLKSIEKKIEEKTKNLEEICSLKEQNEGLRRQHKGSEEARTGKTLEMDRIIEEKKVVEEELYDIVSSITEINKNTALLQEEYNRIDIKKARAEADMEAIQNRMWDEYEITYTNAAGLRRDIGSIHEAQKKIGEYKSSIKELGHVNVSAIDEYVKTKERYEFMSAQKKDMVMAAEKLQRIIYEMTSIMKKQFAGQFKLINDNFNMVFRELFDGGRAELIITDRENILESGIEIHAQPPGKRLQNMMLLSGGERAFTAIALLFAILRLRPAPFCILDEIEAALDDANVSRFAEYIKKYSVNTQFIMVTHRKGTMEAADTLYGVTMQEHGISKMVSLKMGDKAS